MNIDELRLLVAEIVKNTRARFGISGIFNQVKMQVEDNYLTKQKCSELFLSREGILSLLTMSSEKKVNSSRTALAGKKELLQEIAKILYDKGLLDDLNKCLLLIDSVSLSDIFAFYIKISYFKSLDELIDYIDIVGEITFKNYSYKNFEPYDKKSDLLIFKTICIFLWYGITPARMCDFKISELDNVFKKYKIEKKYQSIIINYGASESQRAMTSGRQSYFTQNDFLFRVRSRKSTIINTHYTLAEVMNDLKTFNHMANKHNMPKILNIPDIKASGLFAAIYKSCENSAKAVRVFLKDKSDFYSLTKKYSVWLKEFYGLDMN